jgi:DNA-binding transcriptional LysR family regulator
MQVALSTIFEKFEMTLQQLKYFIAVTKCGSINKAAESLFITQPTLSTTIKELEKEIGEELFIRTPKGMTLTNDGIEFLSYARQILEQTSLLEQRYLNKQPSKKLFSISTQHYAFAVNAFVNMVKKTNIDEYEFTLRETRTYEIIQDVSNLRSDIGILYMNVFNEKVIKKLLSENKLTFNYLFTAKPHIFVSKTNPLAKKDFIYPEELEEFPCLSFEQGEHNSFYFAEEILSTTMHKKSIYVSDRATIFNLMIGLNGYTISSGIISNDLNDDNITAIPLIVDDYMQIGWIAPSYTQLTKQALLYLDELNLVLKTYDIALTYT